MKIDMHAHWRPPALIDALRARTKDPRITRNRVGQEVFISRGAQQPVGKAFDDVDQRLAEMDRHGITTCVISIFGQFSWLERLPLEESLPLIRLHNDALSQMCQTYEGRFAAFATLPQVDQTAAVAEFERALTLPGIVGAVMPGNAFLTYKDAVQTAPIMQVANRHRAVIFIHHGARPGDPWPRVPSDVDNARRRLGTLDIQLSLSANMVTLCLTDFLAGYPNAIVQLHNLGGNIPYEIERMDHRCMIDTPHEELPSARFARSKVYLDCNSFGPRGIEAAVRLYGEDRIVLGTDGSEFGYEWSTKAVNEAKISDAAKQKIFYGNAAKILSHMTPLAQYRQAAE